MAYSTLLSNITKLEIPRKLAEKSNGFSIDIGGSLMKIVYLSKDEWITQEKKGHSPDKATLYMTSCAKDGIEDAIKFIKEHVYIKHPDSGEVPIIFTTGVGCNQITDRFNMEFNIRIQNTMEFDDFVLATKFLLENLPSHQALADFPEQGFKKGFQRLLINIKCFEGLFAIPHIKMKIDLEKVHWLECYCADISKRMDNGNSLQITPAHKYPYILGQFGSGFALLKVEEDCTYTLMDTIPFGGRTFLDLGCLLTGYKSYEQLMALAETGDANNLNVKLGESIEKTDDSYAAVTESETVIYSFGKVHGHSLGEINKADLARTLLQNICLNSLRIAYKVMFLANCEDLVLTGSFVTSHLTQQLLAEEFEYLRTEFINISEPHIKASDFTLRTIHHAGQSGALGCFLHGCE